MKKFLFLFCILTLSAYGAHEHPEKYYQTQWCNKWGGQMEVILPDKTRVDCITKNFAVEFDFAPKWAESIGQSLYYAKMTGKNPGIILIIEKPEDFKYYDRAKLLAQEYNIKLWYMKSSSYDPNSSYNKKEDDIYIALNEIRKQITYYLNLFGLI